MKNIVATASRPETVEWVKKNGATHVISHREDLGASPLLQYQISWDLRRLAAAQLKAQDLTPSLVFICYDPLPYVPQLATVVRPFGRIGSIVESQEAVPIHLGGLFGAFGRSLSFHWECMFTRSMHGYDLEAQGRILNEVAKLAEEGKLTSLTTVKEVFSVRSLRKAHETIDSGKAIGKIVFEVKDTIEEN